jgi:hypothetical protein
MDERFTFLDVGLVVWIGSCPHDDLTATVNVGTLPIEPDAPTLLAVLHGGLLSEHIYAKFLIPVSAFNCIFFEELLHFT